MKIKSIFMMAASAVAGIYLTSDEGKDARQALQKKKVALEPIVKDLLNQASEALEGSKSIDSDKIRANIERLVNESKETLINLNLEKAVDTIKEAIKVASKKINEATNEVTKQKIKTKKIAAKKAKAQEVKKSSAEKVEKK